MNTNYDLDKIKFATDKATFKRAVGLYERDKVTKIEELGGHYFAVVLGKNQGGEKIGDKNDEHIN